jgi:hypothetical protein
MNSQVELELFREFSGSFKPTSSTVITLNTGIGEKGGKGDKGDTGATGAKGDTGTGAYELAVSGGWTGSEATFIETLAQIGDVETLLSKI